MKLPKNAKELKRFTDFMELFCRSLQNKADGFLGTTDGRHTDHCHTNVAKYMQNHQASRDLVVILGAPGNFYYIAHSLVVNKDESAILADTFSGHFEDGAYHTLIHGRNHVYQVYAAYRISDLIGLSKNLRTFDLALADLKPVIFKGADIPRMGQVLIRITPNVA